MEKVCGGGDDMVEGMQCSDHPYRNNPGGICAFCLQEKLGKLVSSSKSTSFFSIPPQSSSSSPSFRSDGNGNGNGNGNDNGNGGIGTSSTSSSIISLSVPQTSSSSSNNINCVRHHHYPSRNKIPFLLAQKKSKKVMASSDSNLVLKRSKSSTAPGARRHFIDDEYGIIPKKGFWSFLHISTRSSRRDRGKDNIQTVAATKEKVGESFAEENESSPNSSYTSSSSFGRKVARSRSVGCGSRSFSGDFLEKISTGFGDCTLRRVESQREAKPKTVLHPAGSVVADHRIKERVKCGGIFAGFSMISSSVEDMNGSGRTLAGVPHGRSKSWGWAFASPIRAFTRSSNKTDAIQQPPTSNTTPNLDAIPSLLAVRG